ncbi:MAG: LamG domain-containing protein [Clostridia bacterium]|nr:LamG domain-containing protein [Clostridia bacterium]
MKKFKKPLSLVLALTMISSMFSVIDFSLFASAEDSVTTVTYTEDFQNGVTNWEVKNLLDGKITEPAGYAVQMNVVTPDGETEALQPLYYAYDSENDSYTTAGSVALSGYNATAAIFKSDVVPDNFTKKTITGTLKTKDAKYSGSGGTVDSNVPRIVIGEDASGNPISVALYKNEETTAAILPVTYVKAEDNVIYVTQDGSKVWNDVWADRHNTINLNPGRSDGNGGYWGPTINYEIVITPNAAGTYDTKVTFTNTYSGIEANATTATATSTVSGILSKVTSFGINVSGYTGKDRNQYGAYDNVNIVYEVPSKAAANFIAEWEEEFGDGSQYAVESQIDSFLEEYNAAKNALDENIKNAIEDTVFLAKVEAVKASLSATVSFSTAASADFEKTKENSILSYSKSDYFTWTNNATTLSKHNANGWGLSSMVYHKDGTSASPYYYYTQTLLHPKDVKNGTAYRNYTDEVIAPPKSADFYYTYGIYGETSWAAWQHGEWVGVNYAISPTVVSSVKTNITDGEENTVTVTGTKYQTTLYMAEFRIAFLNNDSASEPILANRTFKRKITEIVYSEEDLVQYGEYGLSNSTSSLADSNALYQGTQNSPKKPTIASLLVEGSNNPYEDGALFADIYKLLKVNLSYENDDPSKPVFTIVGKYDTETETGKEFTMKLAPTQTVTSGSERAFGFYTDGERRMSTYGGFADPVVTYDYSKVYAELASAELYNEFCESYADTFSATAEDVKNGSVTLETLNSFLKDYAELSAAYQQQVKENGYYDHMVLLRIAALKNSVLAEADFDNETVENAVVSSGVRYVEGYNGEKAAYFDDSAEAYVDFGDVALGENSFAVSYWFKTDVVLTTTGTIFANDSGITVTNTSVSKTTVNAKIGENEAVTLSNIQSVGDTRWHNVIISVNRGGKLSVYVDGKLAYDVNSTAVYETDISTLAGSLGTGKFVLGANTAYESGLAKASVDEFKIYSDFVTADEALSMYNCEKLGAKINEIENKMATYKEGTRFTQSAINGMNTKLDTAKAVVAKADCSNADTVSAAYDTLKSAFESFLVGKKAIKTVQLASDTHIYKTDNFVYNGSTTTEEEKFQKLLTETKNGELEFNVDTYLNAGDLSETSGTIAMKQAFSNCMPKSRSTTAITDAMIRLSVSKPVK